ncbi:MAG: M48 family metalloprotease [Planctomycetota bacterium]
MLGALASAGAVVAPVATLPIRFAVSRQRETLADATGAAMTRHPGAPGGALEKLAGAPDRPARRNHGPRRLFIVDPFRTRQARNSALATHPPSAERIRRLRPSRASPAPRPDFFFSPGLRSVSEPDTGRRAAGPRRCE